MKDLYYIVKYVHTTINVIITEGDHVFKSNTYRCVGTKAHALYYTSNT